MAELAWSTTSLSPTPDVPHRSRGTPRCPPPLLKAASPVLGSPLPGRWHPLKHGAGFIRSQLAIRFNLNPDGS